MCEKKSRRLLRLARRRPSGGVHVIWSEKAEQAPSHAGPEDPFARAAMELVERGMSIGIGAGRTAARVIEALAAFDAAGGEIRVVAASESTEQRCRDAGLTVLDFGSVERLDLLIDGADEIDRSMRMLKGSRGAVARERIIAWASARTMYMVGAHKVSERIGTNATLAVAVMPFGLEATRAALRFAGLNGIVRRDFDGGFLITDNGNLILDVSIAEHDDLEELSRTLASIPGVVDHGLFVYEADTILIQHDSGEIERLDRPEA